MAESHILRFEGSRRRFKEMRILGPIHTSNIDHSCWEKTCLFLGVACIVIFTTLIDPAVHEIQARGPIKTRANWPATNSAVLGRWRS